VQCCMHVMVVRPVALCCMKTGAGGCGTPSLHIKSRRCTFAVWYNIYVAENFCCAELTSGMTIC
jgi:hypothetical protein